MVETLAHDNVRIGIAFIPCRLSCSASFAIVSIALFPYIRLQRVEDMKVPAQEETLMSLGRLTVREEKCVIVREILSRLGDRWSVRVVYQAAGAPIRFSELKRKIDRTTPISSRVLTRTLKQLERDGLVYRQVFPIIPPRVEYSLTRLGERFLSLANEIIDWTIENQDDFETARREFESQSTRQ
ncbi:MAG: winged helix-turn-helix transcriptional regulator [Parvibaculaceae bacterium]